MIKSLKYIPKYPYLTELQKTSLFYKSMYAFFFWKHMDKELQIRLLSKKHTMFISLQETT